MENQSNQYFKTSDLALCATLCFYGYSIESIDKTNPKKAEFVIKRNDQLENILKAYWNYQLKVEPKAYFNFLKEIKARLYSN